MDARGRATQELKPRVRVRESKTPVILFKILSSQTLLPKGEGSIECTND